MIKDTKLLTKTLVDYLKSQLLIAKKDGIVIHFDGTLMSVVNVLLAKKLDVPFGFKTVTCINNHNKYCLTHLTLLAKQLDISLDIRDLSKDLERLTSNINDTAIQKRLVDMTINIEADKKNYLTVSNQSYSQWCINFPNSNYQNLEQVHLLNRLFYSELQQLAKELGASETIVDREPSHYLKQGQVDKDIGFSYLDLEDYLRNPRQPKSLQDQLIRDHLSSDNRNRFLCPVIQRPSNLLG